MSTEQQTECHYLDLLNEIVGGEKRAGVLLKGWSDKTQDSELKAALCLVARRETSHYNIFKRRVEELGYTFEEQEDPSYYERLLVNCSDMPDIEKIRYGQARQRQRQGPSRGERIDIAIADETVDPLTRSLLRWFAEVEADSGALLRKVYAGVAAEAARQQEK